MNRLLLGLLLVVCLFMTGCSSQNSASPKPASGKSAVADASSVEYFTEKANGDIVAQDGTEYAPLAGEGFIELLGTKTLIGKVTGENDPNGYGFEIGIYACEQDMGRVMLLRHMPDNEWGSFYRKKSAPALDVSTINFIRLEFVGYREKSDQNMFSAGSEHIFCGKGISGKDNVESFFRNIQSGQTAEAAGLYESIEQADGMLRNCYNLGKVYGFFEGGNAVVVPYRVTSFDDQAYSITIGEVEYVLPEEYLAQLGYAK